MDVLPGMADMISHFHWLSRLSEGLEECQKQIKVQSHEIQRLQAEVAKLRLVIASVTDLLQDYNVLGREQIISKMQEIDERERMNIGNTPPETIECPECKHQHLAGFQRCIYCGADMGEISGTSDKSDG